MTARTVSARDLETMAHAAHERVELPGPEGGWATATINGHAYKALVAPVPVSERGPCSHCPPGCGSCWPPDCECYTHQDWPDTRMDPALAARLARCLDAAGCDGRSHDIACNNALHGSEPTP